MRNERMHLPRKEKQGHGHTEKAHVRRPAGFFTPPSSSPPKKKKRKKKKRKRLIKSHTDTAQPNERYDKIPLTPSQPLCLSPSRRPQTY